MIYKRLLSEQYALLHEVAQANGLRLNRVKEYKIAIIIMELMEINLNTVLNQLNIKNGG